MSAISSYSLASLKVTNNFTSFQVQGKGHWHGSQSLVPHAPLHLFCHVSPVFVLRTWQALSCLGGFIYALLLPGTPLILHNSVLFMTFHSLSTVFNIFKVLIYLLVYCLSSSATLNLQEVGLCLFHSPLCAQHLHNAWQVVGIVLIYANAQ